MEASKCTQAFKLGLHTSLGLRVFAHWFTICNADWLQTNRQVPGFVWQSRQTVDPDVGPGQKVGGWLGGRLAGRPLLVGVRHVVPGLLGF